MKYEEMEGLLFHKYAALILEEINAGITVLHKRLDEIENYLAARPFRFCTQAPWTKEVEDLYER